ncbi:MAG: hypothetical protein WCG25_09755 [bacterium]
MVQVRFIHVIKFVQVYNLNIYHEIQIQLSLPLHTKFILVHPVDVLPLNGDIRLNTGHCLSILYNCFL